MRWIEDLNKILQLADPMTQTDVTNAVDGNVQRGYLIIRQLIREGKVMKDGRGEEAVYRLTEAGKVALLAIQTQPEQVIGAVEAVEQIGEEA